MKGLNSIIQKILVATSIVGMIIVIINFNDGKYFTIGAFVSLISTMLLMFSILYENRVKPISNKEDVTSREIKSQPLPINMSMQQSSLQGDFANAIIDGAAERLKIQANKNSFKEISYKEMPKELDV